METQQKQKYRLIDQEDCQYSGTASSSGDVSACLGGRACSYLCQRSRPIPALCAINPMKLSPRLKQSFSVEILKEKD